MFNTPVYKQTARLDIQPAIINSQSLTKERSSWLLLVVWRQTMGAARWQVGVSAGRSAACSGNGPSYIQLLHKDQWFTRATMVSHKPDQARLSWLVLAVSEQLKAKAVEIPKSQIQPAEMARRTRLHCWLAPAANPPAMHAFQLFCV